MSDFFIIIGDFILRLTKLLLKAVLALFLWQGRYLRIHTRPLVDEVVSTHESLNVLPFGMFANL